MNKTQQKWNRQAATIQPADLAGRIDAAFPLPDFRDVDEVVAAGQELLLSPPAPAGLSPASQSPSQPSSQIGRQRVDQQQASQHRPIKPPHFPVSAAAESTTAADGQVTAGLAEPSETILDEALRSDELPIQTPIGGRAEPVERIGLRDLNNLLDVECEPLLRILQERMDSPEPAVYLFCDVDSGLRAGQAALAVARKLADAHGRRVIVIDSDLEQGELTAWLGLTDGAGTRELLRSMYPWQAVASETDIAGLSLIPCGKQRLRFTGPNHFTDGVIRKALSGMLDACDIVLVTTGTAFDNSLHVWSGLVGGTLVTLDGLNSSRSIARAAVQSLNAAGCRVIGCLTTPVKADAAATRKAA